METQGERVTRLRKSRLMSMRALAERMGVSHASLVRIENDRFKPRADAMVSLARALGVSVDYLLTGRETPLFAALKVQIRQRAPIERLAAMLIEYEPAPDTKVSRYDRLYRAPDSHSTGGALD